MNADKNKNIFSRQQNSENIPLAESLEKDAEFIRIKKELFKKTPEGIAWDNETGLHREFIIEEERNYLEARRIFKKDYPNRYQDYLKLEEGFPSKIKTDPEYREQRLEKLTQNISEKAGKNKLTYNEYEKVVDELPTNVEETIQQDFLEERLDIAKKYNIEIPTRVQKVYPRIVRPEYPEPQVPVSQALPGSEPTRTERRMGKRSELTQKHVESRARSTLKTGVRKLGGRAGQFIGNKVVPFVGGKVGKFIGEEIADIDKLKKRFEKAVKIAVALIAAWGAYITSLVVMFIVQIIVGFVIFIFLVLTIIFIINSGAYIVPPGGLTPIGGGPPLPDSCPGIWPIEIGDVRMTQGAYAAGCSHSANNGLEATDYGASEGHEVYAGHDGSIVVAEWDSCVGYHIIIESTCNGRYFRSLYGHLSVMSARSSENVVQGQRIGRSGNTGSCTTGPHLHYSFQCPDADNPCGAADDSYINRPPYMSEPYLPLPVPRGCCTETHSCGISF